jgi:sulfatase maturation enzyme AslB (radical SAM superfamily)
MRINNSGNYEYCRWATKVNRDTGPNISQVTPIEYFQHNNNQIRLQLLNGQPLAGCQDCYAMEQHNKISGRQRQLLKVGVDLDNFDKTMASSPWVSTWATSMAVGDTNQHPQDWQIDLGAYCNSACVFCSPTSSTKLAAEWKRIGFIDQLPAAGWADDPKLVKVLVDALVSSPTLKYLHFIGGETLITPAFKQILQALIDAGRTDPVIGFTTNLSVWDPEVFDLLKQFSGVNLGMSVESFTPVNDYVRWPLKLPTMLENLQKWQQHSRPLSWLLQLRTTPTLLTISDLISVYDYAWQHNIPVESCNFFNNPVFLRPSVLPLNYRRPIIERMQLWLEQHPVLELTSVNTRDPHRARSAIAQDLQSYVNYLSNEPDQSNYLPDLIQFLKKIEASRGNNIIDYLPEYEELFRSAGY